MDLRREIEMHETVDSREAAAPGETARGLTGLPNFNAVPFGLLRRICGSLTTESGGDLVFGVF